MTTVPTQPEAMVWEALAARIASLVTDPVLPIAWPNKTFTVPNDRKCLWVQLIPTDTQRVTINSDGPHRHYGLLQLMVNWPVDKGEVEPRQIAGVIAEHFAADTKMVYGGLVVRSLKRPTIGPSMPEGPDFLTPVTVEFESYI